MDGGEGGRSENDNWWGLQRKDRKRGRVSMVGEEEGEKRKKRKLDIHKGKGRIGHRLYIGGKKDKKGDGIFRNKR